MTFEEIRAAIEIKMSQWSGAPVAFDGAPTPDDVKTAQDTGGSWVRCTIIDGDSFTAGIGSGPCVRRTGLIAIQVFTKRDTGSAPARQLASSLAAHFEYWQSGELETQAARLINAGPDDNYYQMNLNVPWRSG